MKFTDLFIHRPVLASVVSLLLLVVGLRALFAMEVRQYPETSDTVVTVTTTYPGADGALVKGFVTTPLQQAIAEADGIDYLTATSVQGRSSIEAHMRLNYDPKAAVAEIQAKVASQRNVLPEEAEDPVIDATTGDATALMYMAFYSREMSLSQITDYLARVVQPQLQALTGVAKAQPIGNKTFAMRIWLDPARMAALGVSATEVEDVLQRNNFLSGVGKAKGHFVAVDLSATTDVSNVEDFRKLVVATRGEVLVRLQDIAEVELGAEDYDTTTMYKGIPAIFIAIEQAPGQNPLQVAARVHELLPELRAQFPQDLQAHIPYDASVFISESIDEVFKTLAEAVLIVLLVIYLSLGSLRAALVPAVAVPLSLIGGAFLMLLMGFSINLLTLLAMVLAIGLVVDDAIVVVENVHRHIEEGQSKLDAAVLGARELGLPIIAMTTTLVAVYAPIEIQEIGMYFYEVRKKYHQYESDYTGVDTRVQVNQVPGGMISNLAHQLKEQSALDRMNEVLAEIPAVRKDLGYPPLVTPTSQIVGTQAVLNVLTGKRYQSITNEVKRYLQGGYGRAPAAVNPTLQQQAVGKEEVIEVRPADLLKPELDKLRNDIGQLAGSEEDVLTYAMFPEVGRQYLEQRAAGTLVPELLEPPKGAATPARTAPTEFNVVLHGETYHIKVTGAGHKEQAERHFYFTVDGVPEEVLVETLDQVVLEGGAQGAVKQAIAGKRPRASREGHVTTSMPGNIVDVLVKEGDTVTAGQPVLITEAMKMETEVQAPIAGKVTGVFVQKGESVNPDEALIEIEPA